MTAQPKTTSKTAKRLDFGVVRNSRSKTAKSTAKPAAKPATKPAAKSAAKPAAKPAAKSTAAAKPAAKATAKKPAVKKPVVTRGRFMDFVVRPTTSFTELYSNNPRSQADADVASPAPADDVAVAIKTDTSHETIAISTTPKTKRRVISRGIRMDFMRRPKSRPQTDFAPADFSSDSFADSGSSRSTHSDQITPSQIGLERIDKLDRVDDFDAELDSLEELSSDDFAGDDIDAIEAEIAATAAETNDFVKAPKPLFEDPLVKLSKARERHNSAVQAAEAERFREEAIAEAEEQAKRSPYAALYSSDRSPFLTSVSVEKRPLSASAASASATSASAFAKSAAKPAATFTPKPTKPSLFNSAKTAFHAGPATKPAKMVKAAPLPAPGSNRMQRQLDADAKEIHRQTMRMSIPEAKSHKTALLIAIILTVILGAGVGAIIYLIFFQGNN